MYNFIKDLNCVVTKELLQGPAYSNCEIDDSYFPYISSNWELGIPIHPYSNSESEPDELPDDMTVSAKCPCIYCWLGLQKSLKKI